MPDLNLERHLERRRPGHLAPDETWTWSRSRALRLYAASAALTFSIAKGRGGTRAANHSPP